jgi:hypothetical protein
MTRAVATLALAVALGTAPFAALYCDKSTPAAMACCQNKASECNKPAASSDCCPAPVEKDASNAATQSLTGKPQWTSVISFDALVGVPQHLVVLATTLMPRLQHRITWADTPPATLSILRV